MKVTKREIVVSISIIAILLLVGMFISNKISDRVLDKNEKYNKALKIDNVNLFEYGMNTNVGNAFVYGDIKTIDTVSYPEINGEYMYIEKVKERYTMHTRTVTTTVNGKTKTKTETYWTWDRVGSEDKISKKVSFLDKEFNVSQFSLPIADYIDTIQESYHVRYKYYGVPAKLTGTIFTYLSDGNIESKNIPIYINKNISETIKYLDKDFSLVLFWVIWIAIIVFIVYGFYYLDNDWLHK